jgi:hypothetical protein
MSDWMLFTSCAFAMTSSATGWQAAYFLDFFHFLRNIYPCVRTHAHTPVVRNARKRRKCRKYAGFSPIWQGENQCVSQ